MAIRISGTSTLPETPLWETGFESGVLYDGSNYLDQTWETEPANSAYPNLVTSPVHSGTYAARHTIESGGRRCERGTDGFGDIVEGDDLWFSQWTRTNNLGYTNWQVVTQWKNHVYGVPPMALTVAQNGQWQLNGGGSWPGSLTSEPPYSDANNSIVSLAAHANDVWVHWVFHVVFSTDPAVGMVNAWKDGTQVLTDWQPTVGTMYPTGDSYMKYGYYRSTAITSTGYVYHDDIKIGLSAASVGGTG